MHFSLIDRVLELEADRILTLKVVTSAEEYLRDHFEGFPVLPGVLMLEAMVQSGRRLLGTRSDLWSDPEGRPPLVLGGVRGLKYGRFIAPGDGMFVEVRLRGGGGDGVFECDGRVMVSAAGVGFDAASAPVAASGRFALRGCRVSVLAPVSG